MKVLAHVHHNLMSCDVTRDLVSLFAAQISQPRHSLCSQVTQAEGFSKKRLFEMLDTLETGTPQTRNPTL